MINRYSISLHSDPNNKPSNSKLKNLKLFKIFYNIIIKVI